MILILSLPDDSAAAEGERRLRARGEEVFRFDSGLLPDAARLSLRWDARGNRRHTLIAAGRTLALDDVRAVWHRRTRPSRSLAVIDPADRDFSESETAHALKYLWSELRVPFVPAPLPVLLDRQDKLRQLDIAGALGFAIPPTCVTNDPRELLAFVREHGGRCVTKHLTSASMEESGLTARFMRFTEPVTHRDLAALESVRLCPTLVQAYVEKRLELRVTVVGRQVFAAEIHSQAAAHTRHDWRKYDHARAPYFVHSLPAEIEARCVALTERLGLRYGALDLVLAPDGQYVFLEINPAGEYQWVEARTGLPITDAICELLVSLAAEGKA